MSEFHDHFPNIKFGVTVELVVTKQVFVHALDKSEARDIAEAVLSDPLFRKFDNLGAHGEPRAYSVNAPGDMSPEQRMSTFVCSRCNRSSMKSAWGPGRVRCPCCGEIERSALEEIPEKGAPK